MLSLRWEKNLSPRWKKTFSEIGKTIFKEENTCDGVDDQKQVAGGESGTLKGGKLYVPWSTEMFCQLVSYPPGIMYFGWRPLYVPGSVCHGPRGRPSARPGPPSWSRPARGCAHTPQWTFNIIMWSSHRVKKSAKKLVELEPPCEKPDCQSRLAHASTSGNHHPDVEDNATLM